MQRLIIILLLISNHAYAQNTWFKLSNGWQAQGCFIHRDTIYAICAGTLRGRNTVHLTRHNYISGNLFDTDTLDYFNISRDSLINNQLNSSSVFLYDSVANNLQIGFSYGDTSGSGYKWRAGLFNVNPFYKTGHQLSVDTFDTHFKRLYNINGIKYAITTWLVRYAPQQGTNSWNLVRLMGNGQVKLVKQQVNDKVGASSHKPTFEKLHADNQNPGNLFLQMYDLWDYAGGPQSWQADVVKIDTSGKTIWTCRPNNRDSINPTLFQMVQKPDGNIICCWIDLYHPPHKHPKKDNPYIDNNDSSTIWFAEIDYQTGKVLWRKNIRQYLEWKMSRSDIMNDRNINDLSFYDAQLVDNGIVWAGHRSRTYNYMQSWKRLPVILKTDLLGNPVWYREFDLYPTDDGDKGMQVYSFTQTPDKGFILSGEYENRYGPITGGEYWQKAALLKLDSFGCLVPGCHATDGIATLTKITELCRVFPNPSTGQMTIELPQNLSGPWDFTVTDGHGRIVSSHRLEKPENFINLQNLANGIYLIQLHNMHSNQYETHKIIIQH